jgi:hypothetical protein
MQIPINYVNGVIVLPGSQILTTKYTIVQEPIFMDDYEVTFQCTTNENEDELLCLAKEINTALCIDLICPLISDNIQLLKFGTFPGPYTKSNITLYFLKIINTVTFEVRKNYELRTLSFEKAFNESLHPLISGYYNNSGVRPEYTGVAEHVLQRIHSYGGLIKCMKDSS